MDRDWVLTVKVLNPPPGETEKALHLGLPGRPGLPGHDMPTPAGISGAISGIAVGRLYRAIYGVGAGAEWDRLAVSGDWERRPLFHDAYAL
jgi:hypothetical protein